MELEEPTEIYVRKALAGSIENVRLQLIDSIEALGYTIIEEEPNIIGRQGSKGWNSANVLDHARTVTVRLKPVSENSTTVTFDYLIKSPMIMKGDKDVILQEAETIAAISKTQAIERMCPVCETESTDDSKFCRKCGSPLTSEQADLEYLRMMAETRAGKSLVVASTSSFVVSTLVMILALILNNAELIKPKLFPVLLIFGGLGILFSMITSFLSWKHLKRALETPETKEQRFPRADPNSIASEDMKELPPRTSRPASVTEGTTNLLDEELLDSREKEKVPVSKRRVTNELD